MEYVYSKYADQVIQHFGLKHKSGSEYGNAPCPNCGGTDRFWISEHEGRLTHHCRKDCNFVERQRALERSGALPALEMPITVAPTNATLPYHMQKRIELDGTSAVCDGDTVVVKLTDIRTGEFRGKQFIKPDGSKSSPLSCARMGLEPTLVPKRTPST